VVAQVLDEIFEHLRPGQYVIDTTTGKPSEMAAFGKRLAERGVRYLDATVAGSSAQVRARQVTVLVGGEAAAFESCLKVLAPFAARCFHVGPHGAGAKFKLVHNLVLGLHRAVLGEALAFAEALDLDLGTVLDVLKQTPAYSCVMDSKGRKMVEGDFTPQATLSQHLKDVRLMLAEAAEHRLELPLTRLHETLLLGVEAAGLGGSDNSAIISAFRGRSA
jgi:3-hydroxyisobutyrate dehydrogenase-like beta-hydroxyacid dehydrogenase